MPLRQLKAHLSSPVCDGRHHQDDDTMIENIRKTFHLHTAARSGKFIPSQRRAFMSSPHWGISLFHFSLHKIPLGPALYGLIRSPFILSLYSGNGVSLLENHPLLISLSCICIRTMEGKKCRNARMVACIMEEFTR